MHRPISICALFAFAAAALCAQQASQPNSYEGTSNPPPDNTIVATAPVNPAPAPQKPAPGKLALAPSSGPAQSAYATGASAQGNPSPAPIDPSMNYPDPSMYTPDQSAPYNPPVLSQRVYDSDPDGDIVHPRIVVHPGELLPGTTIRVRLMGRLSTGFSERGDAFRTRVASDVYQGSQVLIPAGSEIDGHVLEISRGHFAGHGEMRLRPEFVTLPNGRRYRIDAMLTGTPGSSTDVGDEGTVRPGSRMKTDGIEYGAGVGGGAVTGAFIGGPVGALTGSIIGAGVVSVHLLVSHPQATLHEGTVLLFSLTQPLYLTPSNDTGEVSQN